MAMTLITHDLGIARGRTDEVLVLYGGRVMEHAPTNTLFSQMRHPYTEALLASTPRLDQEKHARLTPIPGAPPDIVDPPPGCRFAPRCKYAQPKCVEETPEVDHGGTHRYACFFPVGTDAGAEALATNRAAGETAVGLAMSKVEVTV